MSVELFTVHLLLWFLLLFLLLLTPFRAVACSVASVFAFETSAFLHQFGSFIERQSVDVHSVWSLSFLGK